MRIKLSYGREGLEVDLPADRTTVIEPHYLPGLPDETEALRTALRNPAGRPPLRELAGRSQRLTVSVCDVTRPIPTSRILPVVLEELEHVPREQIAILVAAGTHRPNTPDELDRMLGPEIARGYRVVNHSAFDEAQLRRVGETPNGIPIWLNRHWVESEVRITLGFVEPHFFAGFSGGPKMVAPGLAGFATIMELHSARLIAHPNATWGVTEGNPIHDAIREIARRTGVHFSLDVTLNRDRRVTGVWAGELFLAHGLACQFARSAAMREVPEPFDVVITTNSGYPLDLNLYQSVKGMSAAARVVRPGGAILCAAECSDGIPDHGEYGRILASAGSPSELLERISAPGYSRHDQWQVQIQAQIQLKARVYLKASGLDPHQIRAAHLNPVDGIEETVEELLGEYGEKARICVLPEGPQTIPYVVAGA